MFKDQAFDVQIVSIHTETMEENQWCKMKFCEAEAQLFLFFKERMEKQCLKGTHILVIMLKFLLEIQVEQTIGLTNLTNFYHRSGEEITESLSPNDTSCFSPKP